MTKLLQCLRDELVRRDYAATTIRSYLQIVGAFRQHTDARRDGVRFLCGLTSSKGRVHLDGELVVLTASVAVIAPVRAATTVDPIVVLRDN